MESPLSDTASGYGRDGLKLDLDILEVSPNLHDSMTTHTALKEQGKQPSPPSL